MLTILETGDFWTIVCHKNNTEIPEWINENLVGVQAYQGNLEQSSFQVFKIKDETDIVLFRLRFAEYL